MENTRGHAGIDKVLLKFREKYYFPDFMKLTANIIKKCEICNLSKSEHRNTELPLQITAETQKIREKYVIDYYFAYGRKFLASIDIHSKFAQAIETKNTDWIKRTILRFLEA